MTTFLLTAAWWAAGMTGGWLVWWDCNQDRPPSYRANCPSRAGVLAIILGGCFGLGILILATATILTDWAYSSKTQKGWWSQPICGKKEDDK